MSKDKSDDEYKKELLIYFQLKLKLLKKMLEDMFCQMNTSIHRLKNL